MSRVYLLAFLLTAQRNAGADRVPSFKDFRVTDIYRGDSASPIISSKEDHEFHTILREAAASKPVNFAGHYALTTFGCGAQCVMGAAIDAKTGTVVWIPFTICCWGDQAATAPIHFRKDSSLIIVRGSRNETGNGTYYYALTNGKFVLVRGTPVTTK